jgi:hypothetical protein
LVHGIHVCEVHRRLVKHRRSIKKRDLFREKQEIAKEQTPDPHVWSLLAGEAPRVATKLTKQKYIQKSQVIKNSKISK